MIYCLNEFQANLHILRLQSSAAWKPLVFWLLTICLSTECTVDVLDFGYIKYWTFCKHKVCLVNRRRYSLVLGKRMNLRASLVSWGKQNNLFSPLWYLFFFIYFLVMVESRVSLNEWQKGHLWPLAAIHSLFNHPYSWLIACGTWYSPFSSNWRVLCPIIRDFESPLAW